MPKLGEVVKAPEIGQQGKYKKLIWTACRRCGKERWVTLLRGQPRAALCEECYRKHRLEFENTELVKLYSVEKSAERVAHRLGLGRKSVTRRLKELGVLLPRQEIARLCAKRGADHYMWKGGKTEASNGYRLIKQPEHPRAYHDGYVMEHILVWEETHKRKLPDGWVIHHLNGVKADNRPRNLLALPKGKHHSGLLLQEVRGRVRELEIEVRQLQRAFEDSQMIFYISEN